MEYYDEFVNNYYTPIEDAGENANWKAIEKGFNKIENNLAKPFVVTFTNDAATESNPFAGHVDKTEEEIRLAYEAGMNIVGHVISEQFNLDYYTRLIEFTFDDENKINVTITSLGILNDNVAFLRLYTNTIDLEYSAQIYFLQQVE